MFCALQAPGTSLRASEEPLTQTECALRGNRPPAGSLGLAAGRGWTWLGVVRPQEVGELLGEHWGGR